MAALIWWPLSCVARTILFRDGYPNSAGSSLFGLFENDSFLIRNTLKAVKEPRKSRGTHDTTYRWKYVLKAASICNHTCKEYSSTLRAVLHIHRQPSRNHVNRQDCDTAEVRLTSRPGPTPSDSRTDMYVLSGKLEPPENPNNGLLFRSPLLDRVLGLKIRRSKAVFQRILCHGERWRLTEVQNFKGYVRQVWLNNEQGWPSWCGQNGSIKYT